MVVCLCQGVSDRSVRASIEAGARTRQQVTNACGAGDGCGTCHRTIKSLIAECRGAGAAIPRRSVSLVFGETAPSASI
ncbi:MAG: (2Fe-2S)-binding protein [Deltaproteobacteria bacterium]|nr:(2Fe-2S)-binding protein [Deltaproteobacteria bacterium]